MKYDRILCDVSNIYYRAYSKTHLLTAEVDGEQMVTGGIYTTLKMLQRFRRDYLADEGRMYYLFDNPSSGEDRRKRIDPAYKANRKKKEPQFYRGLDYLYLVLQSYLDDDRLTRRPGSEADDFVAPIIASFGDNNRTVLMISNDLDWSRSIDDNVHWLTHSDGKDVLVTKDAFKERYGFEPSVEAVCLYKAIRGDSSDNIPVGVKNIREEMLFTLIKEAKSVYGLYDRLYSLSIPEKWKEDILLNKGRVLLNYSLVRFQDISVQECREYTEKTQFNKMAVGLLYRALKFNPDKIDSRFIEDSVPLKEDDFFDAEPYPRA